MEEGTMALQRLDDLRERFVGTLAADVDSLVRLYHKDEGTVGRPGEWLRAIKRSAVVLIAANLENFIEDLVCEALTILADNSVKARNYPEAYRLWRFRESAHMRNLGVKDAKELIELSLKLYSDVRELRPDELMLEELRGAFANPTASNVDWIMQLLGKDAYLSQLSVVVNGTSTPVRPALDELARRRNAVAHGDATQDPTIADVERLSKFALMLSGKIKRDVTAVTERCLGA
jgi:hypothetical protein